MKIFIIPFLLVPLFLFSQGNVIQEDKVNLSILKIDYDSLTYEGGNINYYPCDSCSNDSLPFIIDYHAPGDFGNIKFKLLDSSVIFNADIIWMGMGDLLYPTNYSTQFPFSYSVIDYIINVPITYFDMEGNITTDATFINSAQSALNILSINSILGFYFPLDYQIAVYLWPPSVGMFDPSVAKWIVFVYFKGDKTNHIPKMVSNTSLFYPNPATNWIITYSSPSDFIEIFDVFGKKILETRSSKIDCSSFENGMYTIRFTSDSKTTIQKLIVEK